MPMEIKEPEHPAGRPKPRPRLDGASKFLLWMYRLSIPLLLVVGLLLIGLSWVGRDPAMRSALVIAGAGAATLALLRPGLHGPTSLGPRGFASHLLRLDEARQMVDEVFAEVAPEDQVIEIHPAEEEDEATTLTPSKGTTDKGRVTAKAEVEETDESRNRTEELKRRLAEKLAAAALTPRCGSCGKVLPNDWDVPVRQPCPNCGSIARPAHIWME